VYQCADGNENENGGGYGNGNGGGGGGISWPHLRSTAYPLTWHLTGKAGEQMMSATAADIKGSS